MEHWFNQTDASQADIDNLLNVLHLRFNQNNHRHQGMDWTKIEVKLIANPDKLRSLYFMELSGGEPDVVMYDSKLDQYRFFDCAQESPPQRRNVCYDRAALESRKQFKPLHSAQEMASKMGTDLLSVEDYQFLQSLGAFDLKTSSWVKTPDKIRCLGGALFCDRRFDTVFTYHNGAESYYSGRGFRTSLTLG